MTRFNLSFDEAEEEEDIVDIEVEEEPAKPEAASTNNLQVGGKTFDEILSLNRDEYREFLRTLSDNDKRFVGTLRNLANRG